MAEGDDTRFNEWEGIGTLSNSAFMLHGYAMVESAGSLRPGWIGDEWLTKVSPESTVLVLELETMGLWIREGDGYRIEDDNMAGLIEFNDRMAVGKLECAQRGHHDTSEDGTICTTCLKPL